MQYIILAATVLIVVVNVLVGIARGFSRGLLRLITLIGAAVGAFLLSKSLSQMLAGRLESTLLQALSSNDSFAAFLEKNPLVGDSAGVLTQMLLAPILFLLCYMVLKMVTLLIYGLLRAILSVGKPKNPLLRLVGGACMGLLAGLIGVLVFVTPVMGYTQLMSRTIEESESLTQALGSLGLEEYNEKYIAPAATAPLASSLYNGLGSKLFDGLTTVEFNGADAKLETEWFAVTGIGDHAAVLAKRPVAEYGSVESEAVHALAKGVDDSRMLSALSSGAISGFASSWLEGQPFLGAGRPATGDESVDVILNGFVRVLSTTDPELIGQDLENFADLFDLFIKYEIFAKIGAGESTDQLVTHLATSGFLQEARSLLSTNPRLEPVVNAISDAGMRMLVRSLGDPSKYLEEHGELMQKMSTVLKNAVDGEGNINTDALSQDLNGVFAEHQVTVPDSASDIIAKGLADEFTADELNTLTTDQISNRLVDRFAAVDGIEQYVG